MNSKKIAVVSSTRADYNYLRLILKKIIKSEKLELYFLVTGAHLLEKYGKTINFIRNDNIPIAEIVEMYKEGHNKEEKLGLEIGTAIGNFTKAFNKIKPDFLLVLGDRYEILAAVIAASTFTIPIGHIHGGDSNIMGQIDEILRHSITKFAHIHFPATFKSAKRIKLLGEEEWRINLVGSPSIDHFFHETFLNKEQIYHKLCLDPLKKLVICILHPYTLESSRAGEQMAITLKTLKDLKLQTVIIYPNNDPGNDLIIQEIKNYEKYDNFKVFRSLESIDFYSLMNNADLLVGNSSLGLIESAIFKLPVVNIGNRNWGRESGENVIHVAHNYKEIFNAINEALSPKFKEKCNNTINQYGDGNASERIVKILETLDINQNLLIKKLTYDV